MKDSRESRDRILVVDDDAEARNGLVRSLGRLGYEVLVASNGGEGLKMALESAPQVILTDIRMPEMDGHTLLRRLSSLGVDASVVVMSAHGDMDDVVDVLRHGAVDYLKKPWTASELASAVGRAIELYEKRRLKGAGASVLDGSPKPRWTLQNRPFVDGSKPAITAERPRQCDFYLAASS